MTLIQAQQRYTDRVLRAHPGHQRRVRNSAAAELKAWAVKHGMNPVEVYRDARDMLELELACEE